MEPQTPNVSWINTWTLSLLFSYVWRTSPAFLFNLLSNTLIDHTQWSSSEVFRWNFEMFAMSIFSCFEISKSKDLQPEDIMRLFVMLLLQSFGTLTVFVVPFQTFESESSCGLGFNALVFGSLKNTPPFLNSFALYLTNIVISILDAFDTKQVLNPIILYKTIIIC